MRRKIDKVHNINSAQVIKDHFNYHNSFQLAYLFKIRSQGLKRKRQMMRCDKKDISGDQQWKKLGAIFSVMLSLWCDEGGEKGRFWKAGGLVMWAVKKGGALLLPPLPPITDILNGGEQLGLGDGNICYVNLGRDGAHPLVGVARCAVA